MRRQQSRDNALDVLPFRLIRNTREREAAPTSGRPLEVVYMVLKVG